MNRLLVLLGMRRDPDRQTLVFGPAQAAGLTAGVAIALVVWRALS